MLYIILITQSSADVSPVHLPNGKNENRLEFYYCTPVGILPYLFYIINIPHGIFITTFAPNFTQP